MSRPFISMKPPAAKLRLYFLSMKRLTVLLGLVLVPLAARGDCSLTNIGIAPLPELGFQQHKGFAGGLYPDFNNQPPAGHLAAGLNIAENEIRPLDTSGNVDTNDGKIVLLSIGMSNTTQEWASKGPGAFRPRANADPAKNPQVLIVDGAQGGQASTDWTNFNSRTWTNVQQRLAGAGATTNQVQVIWMKQAQRQPPNNFPTHAQSLQKDLETILRVARSRYPNLKIACLSSRTRAYVGTNGLNPEPQAYESAFSVKWLIEKQINGDATLNFDPAKGAVVAPYVCWGPYLWADGLTPRSDGFIWECTDLEGDYTHPNTNGVQKVGDQLLAFFKTHPTATPWFLRKTVTGQPPSCTVSADTTNGIAPLAVQFTVNASDPDGTIRDYQWTFDDGTFSTNASPTKIFATPGVYHPRVTVTDDNGNAVTLLLPITVAAAGLASPSFNDGRFQFTVVGVSNYDYVVQRSDDLNSWFPVATNQAPFVFAETSIITGRRFYRALIQP